MLSNNKAVMIAAAMLGLVSHGARAQVSDAPTPLGQSYTIGGTSYAPADPISYDEVGYAVESTDGSRGGTTANGETFVPFGIGAAHKTLPLPSYVEVTALDSGRTILVRVNDRGPMRNDQLIGLSPGAAAQLGVSGQTMVPVRVRRVNPPEQERAALRGQGHAAERLETPAGLLKVLRTKLVPIHAVAQPAPYASTAMTPTAKAVAQAKPANPTKAGADFEQPPPAPRVAAKPIKAAPAAVPAVPRTGGYVVQVGAFSSQPRAEALAKSLGARTEAGGGMWRVRLGPYPTQQAAQAGVRTAAAKGFENVRIMANDAR
jgi:rare lipoprotein A